MAVRSLRLLSAFLSFLSFLSFARGIIGHCSRIFVTLALVVTVCIGVLSVGPNTVTAATVSQPNWSVLQAEAIAAVGAQRDAGSISVVAGMSATASTSFSHGGSTISADEASMVLSDDAGAFVMTTSYIGEEQLVVAVTSLAGAPETTILVLAPDGAVSTVYGPHQAQESSVGEAVSCDVVTEVPYVIGSIFGPLIDGYGAIWCSGSPGVSLGVALYEHQPGVGSVGLNDIADASGASAASADAYYPCSEITRADAFETALGADAGGMYYFQTSGWAGLPCAL